MVKRFDIHLLLALPLAALISHTWFSVEAKTGDLWMVQLKRSRFSKPRSNGRGALIGKLPAGGSCREKSRRGGGGPRASRTDFGEVLLGRQQTEPRSTPEGGGSGTSSSSPAPNTVPSSEEGGHVAAEYLSGGATPSVHLANSTVVAGDYLKSEDFVASRSRPREQESDSKAVSIRDESSKTKDGHEASSLLGNKFGHEDLSHAKKYSKKLKNRNYLNIGRKVWHFTFGVTFALMNECIPRKVFVPGMAFITSFALVVELLRYRRGFNWMNDAIHAIMGGSLRKHEMEGKFTGTFYYFLGVLCTAAWFPRTAATLGIMQLAVADPSASYFGRRTRHIYWSRIERGLFGFGRNKGILGFLGGAVACVPFNYRILSVAKWGADGIPGGKGALLAASLALGLAGALADLAVPTPAIVMPEKVCGIRVPPFHVDDNVVVPILSAFACTKIFDACGWGRGLTLSNRLFFPAP